MKRICWSTPSTWVEHPIGIIPSSPRRSRPTGLSGIRTSSGAALLAFAGSIGSADYALHRKKSTRRDR